MIESLSSDMLIDCVITKMPFGKYQGVAICDLPEHYLLWFAGKDWPAGKLGQLMMLMLEIRINGLESLLQPIKEQHHAN